MKTRRIIPVLAIAVAAALAAPAPAAADAPPAADFTVTPPIAAIGQPVIFLDNSADIDGQIVTREWDLNGDGTFRALNRRRVVRRYTRARCVNVRLRVTDNAGNSAEAIKLLVVIVPGMPPPNCPPPPPPPPPTIAPPPPSPDPPAPPPVVQPPAAPGNASPAAAYSFAPASPRRGQAVTFTSASSDADGTLTSQAWDLDGDGQFDDASGPSARRTFTATGAYTVSLRVTDDRGAFAVASRTVTVVDADTRGTSFARLPKLKTTVRIFGFATTRAVRIRRLTVRVTGGSTIVIRCTGSSCPYREATTRSTSIRSLVRFRRFEKSLRFGTVIRILITKEGRIGRYTRFRLVRRASPQREDRCLRYGSERPVRCPSDAD